MKFLKRLYFVALVLFFFQACVNPKNETKDLSFSVKGCFKGLEGDTAYLKHVQESGLEFIDSALVDQNGNFVLRGVVSKPDFFVLHFSGSDEQITLVPDTCQEIIISSTDRDYASFYDVKNSPESEDICHIINRLRKMQKITDSLGVIFRKSMSDKNLAGIKYQLDSVYNLNYNELRKKSEVFLKENPKTLSQIVCLSQYITPKTPLFDPQQDYEIYKSVCENLVTYYPDNYHTKKLVSFLERQRLTLSGESSVPGRITSGMKAPEIALKNIKGDTLKLSKFKGKYILVDFWASWSDVSQKNTENITKLYWKYYKKNFAIFQVALDTKYEVWKQALKDQKIPWVSVSDLKGWGSKAALDYGVKSLPSNFLIYPDFTVHEINTEIPQLDKRLKDLLK